jgi:hypothetical protein
MEAAVLVDIEELKKYGFDHESGSEHTPWRHGLRDNGELVENIDVTPYESYAYVWGAEASPHKTSGHLGQPNNFEVHKEKSTDFGEGQKLTFVSPKQVERLFLNVCKSMNNDELDAKMNSHLQGVEV